MAQIEKLQKETNSNEVKSIEMKLTSAEYEIYKLIEKIEALTRDTIDKFVMQRIEREVEQIKKSISEYLNEYKGLSRKLKAEKIVVD